MLGENEKYSLGCSLVGYHVSCKCVDWSSLKHDFSKYHLSHTIFVVFVTSSSPLDRSTVNKIAPQRAPVYTKVTRLGGECSDDNKPTVTGVDIAWTSAC